MTSLTELLAAVREHDHPKLFELLLAADEADRSSAFSAMFRSTVDQNARVRSKEIDRRTLEQRLTWSDSAPVRRPRSPPSGTAPMAA